MKKLFVLAAVAVAPLAVFAATDMQGVVTEVSGYWDAVLPIGIGILLFGLGRRALKKGV